MSSAAQQAFPADPSAPPPAGGAAALRQRLAAARLYLCTDARTDRQDLPEFLDAVLGAGVDIVQLRQKGLEAAQELALLEVVADAPARHGALWAVSDRVDVAHACAAPVVHLGQDDLPVAAARRILGAVPVLGRSTHSPGQADRARTADGVDYYCVGPTWTTPTKPGRPAAGLELVAHAAAHDPDGTGRPWFAIGGIENAERLEQVIAAGARRVVVVRAITEADDPAAAAAAFAARLAAAG